MLLNKKKPCWNVLSALRWGNTITMEEDWSSVAFSPLTKWWHWRCSGTICDSTKTWACTGEQKEQTTSYSLCFLLYRGNWDVLWQNTGWENKLLLLSDKQCVIFLEEELSLRSKGRVALAGAIVTILRLGSEAWICWISNYKSSIFLCFKVIIWHFRKYTFSFHAERYMRR